LKPSAYLAKTNHCPRQPVKTMLRKLTKVYDSPTQMHCVYSVEGTGRHVLELIAFGFAYSSRFILLKNQSLFDKLQKDDPSVTEAILQGGSRLGKILKGDELKYDPQDQSLHLKLE
jgi:hypothetical protein